jgi:hypothetical protein
MVGPLRNDATAYFGAAREDRTLDLSLTKGVAVVCGALLWFAMPLEHHDFQVLLLLSLRNRLLRIAEMW